MREEAPGQITILGLGNLLCGDDGFGVHVAERLRSLYEFPAHVQLIDGGTQGPTLRSFVEESQKLLVLDAVDFNLAPWDLAVRGKEEIPAWLGMGKISPHQNSFSECLALASLRGRMPEEVILIGCQAVKVEFGSELSAEARARIPEAIQLALGALGGWGVKPVKAERPTHLLNSEMLKKIY